MPNRLRIFYAADIHGSEQCFRKFLNAAKAYEADAIILGGDITGKILVPIVKRKDGSFYVKVFGQRHYGANPEDLLETTAALEDSGLYPQAISEEELDELIRDPAQQKSLFQKAMHQ